MSKSLIVKRYMILSFVLFLLSTIYSIVFDFILNHQSTIYLNVLPAFYLVGCFTPYLLVYLIDKNVEQYKKIIRLLMIINLIGATILTVGFMLKEYFIYKSIEENYLLYMYIVGSTLEGITIIFSIILMIYRNKKKSKLN